MRDSLFLRVFAGHVAVIVLLAAAVAVFAPPLMRQQFIREQEAGMRRLAVPLERQVRPYLEGLGSGGLQPYVTAVGAKTGIRITVIEPDGHVLADSEEQPATMENHLYRPEIQQALRGREQTSIIRRSSTLGREMMYVSFPLEARGTTIGVLRLSRFMAELDALFGRLRSGLLKTLGLVALAAFVLALFFTQAVYRPVREFTQSAARVAAGDFSAKVSLRYRGTFGVFARSFNAMTDELAGLFEETRLKSEELDSIIASLPDGLCVVGADDRITLCNGAFRSLVQVDRPEGKYYWEIVRSSKFAEIMKAARETGQGAAGEMELGGRAYACAASRTVSRGRLVVMLHDVTGFRDLERIKKDFVMNVSHELKTPLAAIKGFVETMGPSVRGENRAYLDIIERNTDRLIAIVEDLLVLSELEEKGARTLKEAVDVRALAEYVLKIFERPAAAKGLALGLDAPPGVPPIQADPFEIERLLVNLVDNAVKYTERGRVAVKLEVRGTRLAIEVSDTGIGIDTEHVPHVFERFYVADKSRSKKLGGTGLGLSIAKHIVQAHQGTISVKSRPGKGTAFTVELPVS
jgi:two-component system phosphate regulon sensor histidine kinase PhoR